MLLLFYVKIYLGFLGCFGFFVSFLVLFSPTFAHSFLMNCR